MSIDNDEYLMRLMRARFDLMEVAKAAGLHDEARQTLHAVCDLIVYLINEQIMAIGFETEQAATLHAQGIYAGMKTLPVVVGESSW